MKEDLNENNKLLNPKNDYVFKRIFGHKGNEIITKAFLEKITNTKIEQIEIEEEYTLEKDLMTDKIGILDIKALLDNKIQTDIEMQIANSKDVIARMLFYWSRLFTSAIKEGESYSGLKKTIIVLIADFELSELKEMNKYFSKWQIKEADERKTNLDKIFRDLYN